LINDFQGIAGDRNGFDVFPVDVGNDLREGNFLRFFGLGENSEKKPAAAARISTAKTKFFKKLFIGCWEAKVKARMPISAAAFRSRGLFIKAF
jgi:hypothetical protein